MKLEKLAKLCSCTLHEHYNFVTNVTGYMGNFNKKC